MAARDRQAAVRRNNGLSYNHYGNTGRRAYVDGNTARKVKSFSYQKTGSNTARKLQPVYPVQVQRPLSDSAQRNRERANGIGKGYVLFLIVVSAAILFFCIHYLKLQTNITACKKEVTALESQLAQMKEDNDAYYSQVTSALNLNAIKKIAIGKLGMRYPQESQIRTYETEGRSYVRQFQDVPE